MAFGTAFVNAKNLRKRQEAEQDRIAEAKRARQQQAVQHAQELAFRRSQQREQSRQFDASMAFDKQKLGTASKQFDASMAFDREKANTAKAQFASQLDFSKSKFAQEQKEFQVTSDIAERRAAVDEGRLDIAQADEERTAARHEMISQFENQFMEMAFPQMTAPPAASPQTGQQGMGSPAAAQATPAQATPAPAASKEQTREFMTNAAQAYAAIGEVDRADALMKMVGMKDADDFRQNTQEFMRGLQYLNADDTERAAETFSKIINDTGLYGEEYSIDPKSFKGPSEETDGAFTFDLTNDETGERLTQSYQNQEEMIGFLLGNANPVKALEYMIENSDTYRDRSAKAAAKRAERASKQEEQTVKIRQNAIDYAAEEVARRTNPVMGGDPMMPDDEREALFNELMEDFMRRVMMPAQGMGSAATR